MKKLIALLVTLLLSAVVAAEDISLKINDQDISSAVEIGPGSNIKFDISIAKNVLIKDLKAEAENEVIRQIIEEQLSEFGTNERKDSVTSKSLTVVLPGILPAGEHKVKVTVKFNDAEFNDKTVQKDIVFNIIGGGFVNSIVGGITNSMSPEAAAEVVDLVLQRKIEPLQREPTSEEIRSIADQLGLTQLDIQNKNYNIQKIESKKVEQTLTDETINNMIAAVADPNAKAALELLKGMKKPTITKNLDVYELSTKDGSKAAFQSKIIISLSYGSSLNNLNLIENVPKTVAENAADLVFSEDPVILQADPVVKWNFEHIPEGQTKEYSYTVNKKLEEIESVSVAAGAEPGFFTKIIAKIVGIFV
ncbi:MAG: hypothetical protein ABIC04_01935 [Nanoarchaeota archaeon]